MKSLNSTLRLGILLLLLSCSMGVKAQTIKDAKSTDQTTIGQSSNEGDSILGGEYVGKVYDVVYENPHFPGGNGALLQWLSENIRYPSGCACVQGRVIVSFFVEPDGSLSDIELVRKVDPELDEEVVRVVKAMPKWIPVKHNNQPVRAKFTLPITFKL